MNKIKIRYGGTNVGPIYFTDLTDLCEPPPRIEYGQFIELDITDTIKYSLTDGIIGYYSTTDSSIVFDGVAPLSVSYDDKDLDSIYIGNKISSIIRFGDVNFALMCDSKIDPAIIANMSVYIKNHFEGVLNNGK